MSRSPLPMLLLACVVATSCRVTTPPPVRVTTAELGCLERDVSRAVPRVRSLRDVRAHGARQVLVLGRFSTTAEGHWGAVVELEDGAAVFVAHGDAVEGSVFAGALVAVEGFLHLEPPTSPAEVPFAPYLTATQLGPSHASGDFPDMPSVVRLRSSCT